LASSTVPFISLRTATRKYRDMWVVDGGVTNNTPVFTDNLHRQLVFRLSDVFYPTKFLVSPSGKNHINSHSIEMLMLLSSLFHEPPSDYCIEALVVRGAILMSRFLQGQESDCFSWVYPLTEPPPKPSMISRGLRLLVKTGSIALLTGFAFSVLPSNVQSLMRGWLDKHISTIGFKLSRPSIHP
jgi:hypothetical protein